ncbi:Hypothetical protein A7982_09869 [Minicystis rosea]|nr:Hypothetical protein A7982_09869 [Minicystis rosea]
MATKTSVNGNQVIIDGSVYLVTPAGTARYAVASDFGDQLGYFMVKGKAVSADDFGVESAHPVLQIGKLWVAANTAKSDEKSAGPATRGICRIATHEKPSDADAEKARAYRAWMKKQPGCKASYYVLDPATGKALSISIWENREQLAAIKDMTPPDGAAALKSTSVEVYPMVEEP